MDWLARIPLTVRHRYDFTGIAEVGGELDADGWDALRASVSPFGMGAELDLSARAAAVQAVIDGMGARRVCSYGVGTGLLERHLAGVELVCTEYAPATIAALRERFPIVVQHDLRDGPLDGFDLHLLHRVDTELSNREWRRYFDRVREPHLVVVSGFLTCEAWRAELRYRRDGATRAGWLRTERAFRCLIPRSLRVERLQIHDLAAFLIRC